MRVLNVNPSLDPVAGGGTVERTVQMSRHLVKSGIECGILTTDVGLPPDHVERFSDIQLFACRCLWRRFFIPSGSIAKIKRSIDWADIVHLMGHWSILNVYAYVFLRRMKKPYVVCPAGSLPIYGRSKLLKTAYNLLLGKRIMRNASAVIAVTDGDKARMSRYGVTDSKVVIIPNGITFESQSNADPAEFRQKHGLGRARIILFMGRLNHIKGPDLLLHAFCKVCDAFPNHVLVFAGPDGGMLGELKTIARNSGAFERVQFVGYVGGLEKIGAYRAAELLVIPSRQEPMSIVVLEAGREGVPVMVTDRCDFNVIEEIGGGVVVRASVRGLEKGLRAVLSDCQGLVSMGHTLQRYVQDQFSWDSIVCKYIELYEEIVNSQ